MSNFLDMPRIEIECRKLFRELRNLLLIISKTIEFFRFHGKIKCMKIFSIHFISWLAVVDLIDLKRETGYVTYLNLKCSFLEKKLGLI